MALPVDINAPTPGQFIRELHVWIATYPDGTEGIIAGILPELGTTTLVTSRRAVAERMRPLAERAARESGRGVTARLVTFTTTEGTRQ